MDVIQFNCAVYPQFCYLHVILQSDKFVSFFGAYEVQHSTWKVIFVDTINCRILLKPKPN